MKFLSVCSGIEAASTAWAPLGWKPWAVCPREPGEGYEKCTSICRQAGHAEAVAVRMAGDFARGARAYLQGHTYACMACQHALFGAGVISFSVGAPPPLFPSIEDPSA